MARKGELRRLWFQVHLWIGVVLSAVLIPLSLSGALLVWHDWTDAVANPQRYGTSPAAPSLSVSAYADAARAVLKPQERIASIDLPEHAGAPVVVTAAGKPARGARANALPRPTVWLDPATARVLDQGDANQGVLRVLHVFHGTLMIPEVGRKVVGWLGWAMFVSALTGLWLWWPRNGAFLKGLRWTRSPLFTGNLHHQVGFWICLPLAVLAFTGAYISFPQTFKAAVAPMFGETAPAPGGAPAGPRGRARPLAETRLSPDAAAKLAAGGNGRVVRVGWPTEKSDQWTVRLAGAAGEVKVGDGDGRVKADKAPGGADGVARLMRRIHYGTDTGLLWQTLIFVGGIAPAVLGVTGVIMWLTNRGGRRAVEAARRGR